MTKEESTVHSNPVNSEVAYAGNPRNYGKANDPMVGERIGGVNVFGGGLALYAVGKMVVGGIGVSGDTSCADHNIAWRVRHNLGLDHLFGVAGGFWRSQSPGQHRLRHRAQPQRRHRQQRRRLWPSEMHQHGGPEHASSGPTVGTAPSVATRAPVADVASLLGSVGRRLREEWLPSWDQTKNARNRQHRFWCLLGQVVATRDRGPGHVD